jgi:hypothetical protein
MMGGMSERLARCTTDPSCPRRWTSGPDRPCGTHHGDYGPLGERMKALGIGLVPGHETTTTTGREDSTNDHDLE